jgi:hypothetical protein
MIRVKRDRGLNIKRKRDRRLNIKKKEYKKSKGSGFN